MELARASRVEIADIRDLNRAVRNIKKYSRHAATAIWELAGELKEIRDKQLWVFRLDKKGNPKYRSFFDFCRAEVVISEAYIRRLIAVREHYSLTDLKKYGVARLYISTRLPEYNRKDFIQKSKFVPACDKEFRELTRRMRDQTEMTSSISVPVSAQRTTVDLPLGIMTAPMWKRPNSSMPVGKTTTPASSLSEDPWAKFKLSEDLMAYVRLSVDLMGRAIATLEFRQGIESDATRGENDV